MQIYSADMYSRILSAFTLPPDHHRIAIVTPLISGGSLAGILDWRSRLASTPKPTHRFPRFGQNKRSEENEGIGSKGKLEEEEIKAVIKQVLDGLVYLHERGFLHVSQLLLGCSRRTDRICDREI